jgi:hypothetical protein
MECLAIFMVLLVIFVIATGSAARAQSRSARRRRIYQQAAKRFAGVYISGGLFGRPSISFLHGTARALFRETTSRGAYAGYCSEVQVEWLDSRVRLELFHPANPSGGATLRDEAEIGGDVTEFLEDYVVAAGKRAELESILSEGVRWQLNQLRYLDGGESGVYLAIRRGRLIVRKAARWGSFEELDEFLRSALALFDQAMLTQARGIEFIEPELSVPLNDVVCKICGDDIHEEMVFCRRCKTPHHLDCWRYNGACSVYGCQETRYLEPRVVPPSPANRNTNGRPTNPR